jgi:hypothetical protein
MVDPKITVKKAQDILDKMQNNYNDSGDITVPYYEELEKTIFEPINKTIWDQKKKYVFKDPTSTAVPAPEGVPNKPAAAAVPPAQLPKKEEVAQTPPVQEAPKPSVEEPSKMPQKQMSLDALGEKVGWGQPEPEKKDAVHQAAAQVKPAEPEVAPDIYEFAAKHPVLSQVIKRDNPNPLVKYVNERAIKLAMDPTEEMNDERMVAIGHILKELNGNKVQTPKDFFEALQYLSATPVPGAGTDTVKYNSDFNHFRNSMYKHMPMNPVVAQGMLSLMEDVDHGLKGLKELPIYPDIVNVIKTDAEQGIKSIKEVALDIGKVLLPMIGDVDVPTATLTDPQAVKNRQSALAMSNRLREMLGFQTLITDKRLGGKDLYKIKGAYGLPMTPREQTMFDREKTVKKSGSMLYDEEDYPIEDDNIYFIVRRSD